MNNTTSSPPQTKPRRSHYDLIVVGFERVGFVTAKAVRAAGWSVLIAGLQMLDGLTRAVTVGACPLTTTRDEDIDVVSGQLRLVDRRILDVDGIRYEGRHLFVVTPALEPLALDAAEVKSNAKRIVVDAQQRCVDNPAILLSQSALADSMSPRSQAQSLEQEGHNVARTILGLSSPQ